ncbi:hypothetical protein ABB37_07353 [Leptomonas pyrrhocoris]|uniref:Uncharacterized protein n=1 Tax=Leptomonas pyrrhocoris TaxID=157538 RepID=A0A0M9FVY2_LEPPY|nr:hypothetical protein ABB37_07353 [Leptomonas pyrrhocoris]KPA76996.1 hypothetical protein ABB37_07353 [Leptomonas pyrrhocoris]|eukprot:XP_015655435.1 hypothetical protein ABB37_07353 [Leptomonas pyrrhocoris]
MSPLVRRWLWQRAAALPGERSSLLVEWLSLELAESAADHVRGKRMPVADALNTAQAVLAPHGGHSSTASRDAPSRDAPMKVEVKGEENEDENVVLFTSEARAPVSKEDPVMSADLQGHGEERDRTFTRTVSPEDDGVSSGTITGASTKPFACEDAPAAPLPSSSSFSVSSPETRVPAQRILRLGIVAPVPAMANDSVDVPLPSVPVTPVLFDKGRVVMETRNNRSSSSSSRGDARHLRISLLRPTAAPTSTAADGDEGETVEVTGKTGKLCGAVREEGAPAVVAAKTEAEAKEGCAIQVVATPPDTYTTEEEKAATNAEMEGRVRQARWRRIAPFVFYAPRGSSTEGSVRTVLTALGFTEGTSPSSPRTHDKDAVDATSASTSYSPLVPSRRTPAYAVGGAEGPRTGSPSSSTEGRKVIPPRCPLGRLPPLVAAYAWVREAALRTVWVSHIAGACTTPSTAPSPFPCVAFADGRVSAALADLLCVPLSVTTRARSNTDGAPKAAPHCFRLPAAFERNLHAYLCYPLAGVTAAHLAEPATAPPDREVGEDVSRPPLLTVQDWQAYLDFRYGVPARRRRGTPARVGTSATTKDVEGGTRQALSHGAEISPLDEPVKRPRQRTAPAPAFAKPPLLTFSAAATVAAGYAARISPMYSAVMDVAAALVFTELRRACVLAVDERTRGVKVDATVRTDADGAEELRSVANINNRDRKTAGVAQSSYPSTASAVEAFANEEGKQRSRDHSELPLEIRATAVSTAAPAAATVPPLRAYTTASTISPEQAMQLVLEDEIEDDASLCCYAHQNMCGLCAPSVSVPKAPPSHSCPCGAAWPTDKPQSAPGHSSSSSGSGAATGANVDTTSMDRSSAAVAAATAPDVQTPSAAYAANLWLGVVAVLSAGESGVAQHLRSVLLPPTCLPSSPQLSVEALAITTAVAADAASAVGSVRPSAASLAPFTMPTLFRSTLEDLYKEEAALRARPAPPLCLPLGCYPEELKRQQERVDANKAAMLESSVAAVAAIALRHPRLLLRQTHLLWRLSCASLASPTAREGKAISQGRTSAAAADGDDADDSQNDCNDNDQHVWRGEFASRVSSFVECVQLASCAGLPAPLATSLVPAEPQRWAARKARTVAMAPTAGETSLPEKERETQAQRTSLLTRAAGAITAAAKSPAATAAVATSTEVTMKAHGDTSLSPPTQDHTTSTVATATPPPPASRPRLHLRLLSVASPVSRTSSDSVTAGVDTAPSPKCERSPCPAVRESERSRASARKDHGKRTRMKDVANPHSNDADVHPPTPAADAAVTALPPLDGLADLQVRWVLPTGSTANTASAAAASFSASSSSPSLPAMSLITLVSDVLWGTLQHMGTYEAKEWTPGKPLPSTAAAAVTATGSVTHLVLSKGGVDVKDARGGTSAPAFVRPPRRTLMLRLSPAYAELQRVWQALRPLSFLIERGTSDTRASAVIADHLRLSHGVRLREGPALDVVLPLAPVASPSALQSDRVQPQHRRKSSCSPSSSLSAASVVSPSDPTKNAVRAAKLGLTAPSHADVRHYASLAASLRGVLCVSLGYAVYALLHRTWELWTSATKDQCEGSGDAAAASVAPSRCPRTTPTDAIGPRIAASSTARSSSNDTTTTSVVDRWTWLAAQLQTLHDEILQPLNRICTVYIDEPVSPSQHDDDGDADAESGDAGVSCTSTGPRQPRVTTAAWLLYKPFAHRLFPSLICAFDAALAPPAAEDDVKDDDELDGAPLNRPSSRADVANTQREVRTAWVRVCASLQQAGVALPGRAPPLRGKTKARE